MTCFPTVFLSGTTQAYDPFVCSDVMPTNSELYRDLELLNDCLYKELVKKNDELIEAIKNEASMASVGTL